MEIDFYGFFCYREHRETKTVQTTRIKKILGKSFMLLRDMVYFSKRLLKLKKFLIRDRTEKIEIAKRIFLKRISLKDIQDMTDLTRNEIKKLQKD